MEKVTIVPRGRALGVTQFSEDDRFNLPEHYVRARLAVALGGRAGEQLTLGEVSSGAENDLEVATAYARRMVERWGMGDKLGPGGRPGYSALSAPRPSICEGPPGPRARPAPGLVLGKPSCAAGEAPSRGKETWAALDSLAEALVERETVDRSEVDAIVAQAEGPGHQNPLDNPRALRARALCGLPGYRSRSHAATIRAAGLAIQIGG